LQAGIGTIGGVAYQVVSAIQTVVGLEAPGRGLTADEIAMLRPVYGDSIDYQSVRVKVGPRGILEKFGRTKDCAGVTVGNTIYLKSGKDRDSGLLVHEMAHVWQYQNGGTHDAWAKVDYNFARSVPGTPWEGLLFEQQAQILQRAFEQGYFKNGGKFSWDTNGDGRAEDLSDYLRAALGQVAAGQGAA